MEQQEMVEIVHLKDLTQDMQNARAHTPRNLGMIEQAVREVGAARSGVVDEDLLLLAGNGTYEALAAAGIERVKIVDTDGAEWVVVRRRGLTEEQKVRLSLYDNRSAELATWDAAIVQHLFEQFPRAVQQTWREAELRVLCRTTEKPLAPSCVCPACGHIFTR